LKLFASKTIKSSLPPGISSQLDLDMVNKRESGLQLKMEYLDIVWSFDEVSNEFESENNPKL